MGGGRCSHQLLSPSIPGRLGVAGLTRFRKGTFAGQSANSVVLPPAQAPHLSPLQSVAQEREDWSREIIQG